MGCSQRRRGLESLLVAGCVLASCRSTPLVVVTGIGQIDPIDFGRVIVGETSTSLLKIENVQGSAFNLSAPPTIAGVDASDFQLVEPPPLSVAQGGSVTGLLAFSPQDAGPRSGLIGASTDSSAAAVLSGMVTGVGVAPDSITLSMNPSALNFGQVEILTSKTLPLVLTNTGVDSAPLQPFQISAGGQIAYTVALEGELADAPLPLAAGASLSLAVTFTPLVYGSQPAVLQVQACKLCAPLSVPLNGIGFTPGLVFVPPTLTFSAIRGQLQTQAVELLNQGNATGMITGLGFQENGVLLDGGGPFSAQAMQQFPTHLLTGESFSFSVTYAPSLSEVAGTVDQVELFAETSGANVEQTPGQVTGTVKADCVLVVPPSLFVGYAVPPSFDPTQTLTIDNLGVDPCLLTQVGFASGSDPGFRFQQSEPATVGVPGFGSASLAITFAPADTSNPRLRQGTLTMQTNDPGLATASVALSGYTQATPYANLSPWPRFCHDNGNSCLSDVDTSQTGSTLRWRTPIADCGSFSPPGRYPGIYWEGPAIGGDGTIYELGCNGNLNALDPMGDVLWSSAAGSSVVTQPFAYDGNVDGYETFALVPSVTAASQILVATLSLYGGDQLFGFDSDGVKAWAAAPGAGVMASSPALQPDQSAMFTLYGTGDVVSNADGTALPSFPCSSCWGTGVIAADGTSYWLNAPALGNLTVIQILPDGGAGYTRQPPATCGVYLTQAGPTVMLMRDSEIYLSGNEFREDGGTLTAVGAFEAGDLTLDWQYCNTNDFIGSVVALGPDGGVVLTALYSENVTDGLHVPSWYGYAWVDPPGTLRWKNQTPFGYSEAFKMPGFQNFPAIGAEGTIYFTSDTAALIALNSADGTILWSYGFDGGTIGTSPPAIGADGTIYFQDSDGYLDAVR